MKKLLLLVLVSLPLLVHSQKQLSGNRWLPQPIDVNTIQFRDTIIVDSLYDFLFFENASMTTERKITRYYQRDEAGRLIREEWVTLDIPSGNFESATLVTFGYNDYGALTNREEFVKFGLDEAYILTQRLIYNYQKRDLVDYYTSEQFNIQTGLRTEYVKWKYSYDQNGNDTHQVYWVWLEEEERWEKRWHYSYQRDSQGRLLYHSRDYRNPQTGQWGNALRNRYQYETEDGIDKVEFLEYDTAQQAYLPVSRKFQALIEEENVMGDYTEEWNETIGDWVNYRRHFRIIRGDTTTAYSQEWDSGEQEWYNYFLQRVIRQRTSDLLLNKTERWNFDENKWEIVTDNEVSYGQDDRAEWYTQDNYSGGELRQHIRHDYEYFTSDRDFITPVTPEANDICVMMNPYRRGAPITCDQLPNDQEFTFQLTDMLGRRLAGGPVSADQSFGVSRELPRGVYVFLVMNGKEVVFQKKLVWRP